jgi:putative MATE family efflux protein
VVVVRAGGAGHDRAAAGLAAQALWLALGIGGALVILAEAIGPQVLRALGGHGQSGHYALVYLRIAALGLPSALIALAGQGYLRGVSDLRRPLWIVIAGNAVNVVLEVLFVYGFHWGIEGAAAGTAVAQTGMGLAFVRELLRPAADTRRPRLAQIRPLMRVGRHIFVRTAALTGSFVVAASVLARMGDAEIGAHQIAFQLFVFLALVLDAVAIAAQVIVGRMLGAGDDQGAHEAARRMIFWSVVLGLVFAVVLLPLGGVVPRAFTSDSAVLDRAREIWPLFALMQPLGGAVFALDGILIGASDTSFLMWSMLAASLLVYVPIALVALAAGWGIIGVWSGLVALIVARLTLLGARFVGRRWAVVGWA